MRLPFYPTMALLYNITTFINGSIVVKPFAFDFDIRLVHPPRARYRLLFAPDFMLQNRREFDDPPI